MSLTGRFKNWFTASSPRLPLPSSSTDSNVSTIPPFGTNPPNRPPGNSATDLTDREISNDPREQWYLALPSKLTPTQVELIKRSAAGGDIWQQQQLYVLMLDQWPMFKKCDHELREAVSNVRFLAHPYAEEGQEPTDTAKAKADAVRKSMSSMRPTAATDEREFRGMLYHFAGAFMMGIVVEELIYSDPERAVGGKWQQLPRAAAFVHPRHFAFTTDGKVALYDDQYNQKNFSRDPQAMTPDPRKFIVAQFYSPTGSCLASGAMRSLAWNFSAYVYNREWILNTAKQHGAPFTKAAYKQNTNLTELDKFLKQAGPNRSIRYPEGVDVEVIPASAVGSDNPQRYLAEEADRQCQLLLLGQTLTSDSPKNGGGTRAQGQVHMEVRSDRIEGIARWLAAEPLMQFARAVCMVNFGDDTECPIIEPDFTKPLDATEKATFIQSISSSTIPLPAQDTYKMIGMNMPEEGDKVMVGGKIGLLGDTETDIDANPAPEPPPGLGFGGEGDPEADAGTTDGKPVKINFKSVRKQLAKASQADLGELEQLVNAAERAPHQNGEIVAVKNKLANLGRRK